MRAFVRPRRVSRHLPQGEGYAKGTEPPASPMLPIPLHKEDFKCIISVDAAFLARTIQMPIRSWEMPREQ